MLLGRMNEDHITTVRKCKLRWHWHVTRSTGLAKMIIQGTKQGGKRNGSQKKEIGRQHIGMDRFIVGKSPSKG